MSDLKSRSLAPKVPDLTRPSPQALAYLLRRPELWPADFKWGYEHCNTCAMGLAAAQWPEQDRQACATLFTFHGAPAPVVEITATLLGMPYDAAVSIFAQLAETSDIRRMEDVTPLMVADAIDTYLANQHA